MAAVLGPAAGCARRLSIHAAMCGPTAAADIYDVAIVGGGMVGAALACKLSALPGPPCMPGVRASCPQPAMESGADPLWETLAQMRTR